jgi:hypothetical protein
MFYNLNLFFFSDNLKKQSSTSLGWLRQGQKNGHKNHAEVEPGPERPDHVLPQAQTPARGFKRRQGFNHNIFIDD